MTQHNDDVVRLEEIQQEMMELLEEARNLVRGTREQQRAESYWLGHIETSLTNNSRYMGRSMCTMEDTVNALGDEGNQY